jgi:hypothetical protein
MTGDGVSEVISQAPPTFCIQVPMLDTMAASHSARNSGWRSGLQAEARTGSGSGLRGAGAAVTRVSTHPGL